MISDEQLRAIDVTFAEAVAAAETLGELTRYGRGSGPVTKERLRVVIGECRLRILAAVAHSHGRSVTVQGDAVWTEPTVGGR